MDQRNKTIVTEFILLGFQNGKEVEILLFSAFLLMYMTSLIGNTMIILLVCGDYRLHSPMYFFVANLSFLEVAITSTVVPKMLANTFSLTKAISFDTTIRKAEVNRLITLKAGEEVQQQEPCSAAVCQALLYAPMPT